MLTLIGTEGRGNSVLVTSIQKLLRVYDTECIILQLKEKEDSHLKALSEEWKQHDLVRENALKKKVLYFTLCTLPLVFHCVTHAFVA